MSFKLILKSHKTNWSPQFLFCSPRKSNVKSEDSIQYKTTSYIYIGLNFKLQTSYT